MANNAREKIQRVLNKIKKYENGLLYKIIGELLPVDYDKETLFEPFERSNYSVNNNKEFVTDALALIGMHLRRSDCVNNADIEKITNQLGLNTDMMIFKRKYGFEEVKLYEIKKDIFRGYNYTHLLAIGIAVISGFFLNYPKKIIKEKEDIIDEFPETATKTKDISPSEPLHIVMMFILPANKTDDIIEGDIIDSDTAIRIIDDSVYFGCFPQDEAKNIESELDLKGREFSRDTSQDIYISLEVKDGQELIEGFPLKFSLKKRLQNKPREITISKIRLLDKLQGLEKLNRI